MTTLASCAALAESISSSVKEMADGLSSLSSVISKALLHESTFIWRRFEASLLRSDFELSSELFYPTICRPFVLD